MKKWSIYNIAAILTILIANDTDAQSVKLLKTTYLSHYPSASGIAYYNNKLFVMGDDANQLLVLDTAHQPIDSVKIYNSNEKRIPYQIKPDIESLSISNYKGNIYLTALPSFSTEKRNKLYIFPLKDIKKFSVLVSSKTIKRLNNSGIQEPNLEGSTQIKNRLIVSNRANKAKPFNYLITIPIKKGTLKKIKRWEKSSLEFPSISKVIGLSGIEYWPSADYLFFTASTEETSSATADGAIGESYLGFITNFSKQLGNKKIPADKLLNLSSELKIGNQKIEGICIESSNGNDMILHLVTDNDDGQSIVYKVLLTF